MHWKRPHHARWLAACVLAFLLAGYVGGFSVPVGTVFLIIFSVGAVLLGSDTSAGGAGNVVQPSDRGPDECVADVDHGGALESDAADDVSAEDVSTEGVDVTGSDVTRSDDAGSGPSAGAGDCADPDEWPSLDDSAGPAGDPDPGDEFRSPDAREFF